MKKIIVKFTDIFYKLPTDIRQVSISLILSASVMSFLLFSIGFLEVEEKLEAIPSVKCGFEPYIENAEALISVSSEYIECAVSDDIDADLLAKAIQKVCGDESYAVRVAFGAVILNRVESNQFPNSVSAVLRNAGIYPDDSGDKIEERSRHAAYSALTGVDPTIGSLYIMDTDDPRYPEYEAQTNAIYGRFAFIH